MSQNTQNTESKEATKKVSLSDLKRENEALKKRVKELEKQIATYNMHFAKGEIR